MADGASTKNRKIGVIAVTAAAVLVIAFGMLLFGGRSYKKTVNQYVNASFEADAKTVFKLIPAKAVKYGLEDAGYDAKDQKKAIREMKDSMQEQIDYLDRYLGKGWKTSYKITDVEKITGDDLDEIKEDYEDMDVKVSAAKTVEVEINIHSDETETSNSMDISLIKVGRSWYIDVNSMYNLYY